MSKSVVVSEQLILISFTSTYFDAACLPLIGAALIGNCKFSPWFTEAGGRKRIMSCFGDATGRVTVARLSVLTRLNSSWQPVATDRHNLFVILASLTDTTLHCARSLSSITSGDQLPLQLQRLQLRAVKQPSRLTFRTRSSVRKQLNGTELDGTR